MPFMRQFGGGAGTTGTDTSRTYGFGSLSEQPTGAPNIERERAVGACRKCGYTGHLTYQCRNFIKLKPEQEVLLDISSTSSDSSENETPLTAISPSKSKKLKKKSEKHRKEKKKKHHKDRQSSDDDDEHKKKKERKRKHHHRSSPDETVKKSKKKRHTITIS